MLEQITSFPTGPVGQFSFGSLGTPEIIVIMIVALLVFGPRKLPEIGRQIGNAMREFKKFSTDVQDTFNLRDHLDIDKHLNNNNSSYDNTYHQYDSYGEEINTPPTTEYPALDQYGLDTHEVHASIDPVASAIVDPSAPVEAVTKAKRTRKPKAETPTDVAGITDITVLASEISDVEAAPAKKRVAKTKKVEIEELN
jgi:sec-independent protein translocase protein TatA